MLEDTGERIIPERMKPTNGMLLEHLARYYFATPYATGRVLDLACGTGYGTHMVAKTRNVEIREIIGADKDPAAVAYAKKTYYHPKSSFCVADVLASDLKDQLGMFDTILSFETIEHVEDDRFFIRQLNQLLRPGGILVVSTPFGSGRGQPTQEPYHVHQLTETEFKVLFESFADVEHYCQRGVTIEPRRPGVHYAFGVAVCRK